MAPPLTFSRRAIQRTPISSSPSMLKLRSMLATHSPFRGYLVTPDELSSALSKNAPSSISTAPRIVPLSAAWFLPNDPEQRTGWASYVVKRIPKSRFFDLDKVKDEASPYPHMLPSPETFAKEMGRLGIRKDDPVVVYDTAELGIFSAPRVAWTLRLFGHGDVHVLNNFQKWVSEGFPLEEGEPTGEVAAVTYPVPELDKAMVVAFEEVRERVKEQGKEGAERVQVLDARPEGRWKGTDPEPRKGLSSGHMPHSVNVPHSVLLDPDSKALLSPDKLRQIFEERQVSPDSPIISSCGTGVTAAVVDLALAEAGYDPALRRIYDGSWTEWAQRVKQGENLIVKQDS